MTLNANDALYDLNQMKQEYRDFLATLSYDELQKMGTRKNYFAYWLARHNYPTTVENVMELVPIQLEFAMKNLKKVLGDINGP